MDKMLNFMFFLLVGIHSTEAVTHSLKYLFTGSSKVPNFPEFVSVGYVDDVQVLHYDSNTQKAVPTQDWMRDNTDEQYWERQTGIGQGDQQIFKAGIETLKQRFNQTGGVHIVQWMFGVEWDDETGKITSFHQYGYDGEDFISLDFDTETWIAPTQQAVITRYKWNNKGYTDYWFNYHAHYAPGWLKMYLDYGKDSLMRTELPSVSFLQKSSSSPVSCFATGFYPNRAEMFWRKDGEEINEGVEKGEILPNNDGTFQMSVDLKLSSENPEDWTKYECVFQLSGVKDNIITRLEKIKMNITTEDGSSAAMIIPISVAVVVLAVIVVIGFILYKMKNVRRPPSPVENREVQEQMLPTA